MGCICCKHVDKIDKIDKKPKGRFSDWDNGKWNFPKTYYRADGTVFIDDGLGKIPPDILQCMVQDRIIERNNQDIDQNKILEKRMENQ